MSRSVMLFSLGMLLASPSSPATAASSTQNGFLASHYPPNALRNGEDGRVGFSVDIDEQGRIEKCAITQSSGYETLDRETCDFIVQFAGFGPVRDTSGKAQRTFHEIAQLNLVPFGHADEEDCVNTAWQLFDLLEEIHDEAGEDGEKFVVKVERRSDGRSVVDDIDFAKVRMDRASFKLRSWPTNFLASTPTDRWQQIADMAQQGLFSEDELVSLLDFPDLQRVLNLRGAPRRVVEKIIEKFLDAEGEMPRIKPEPPMNLDICVALGTLAYLEAKWIDDVPEENTSALLDFVVTARLMRDGKLDENGNPIQAQDQGQNPAQANGGVGPQPGDQSPDATMPEAMPALGGGEPSQLFAPPTGAPLPGNAVAPQVMPPPGAEG